MGEQAGNVTGKRKILIVEDNKVNQKILIKLLEDEYELFTADNGLEGLEFLRTHYRELSLVLLDVMMPICDGFEFLNTIKDDAILSSVPVIVTTGNDTEGEEEKSLELGAYDFVRKPYRPNIVKKRIRNIIRLREFDKTLSVIEYDELTGLLSKHAFYHHARSLFQKNPDEDYYLMIADVENFKLINDRFGESQADEVLAYIANWVRHADPFALCGRFAGDQFVLLGKHQEYMNEEDLRERIGKLMVEGPIPNLVVKFGIYDHLDKSMTISSMCNRALLAMNRVKNQYGEILGFFDLELQMKLLRSQRIVDCMEEALEKNQFQVYYQPKHDAKSGKLVGAEALVRWIHPEYGFMSPGDFIPLFEQNGFITQLDLYVWKRVCENLHQWKMEGMKTVPISLNASRKDLTRNVDISKVVEALNAYDIEPEMIHMEVTESFYTDRTEEMLQKIKQVQDTGIRIELDDFGVGYSSLGMIKKMPLDVLKLDMSFVNELDNQGDIVEVIIQLAHKLGLKTVAEGVEDEKQLATLKKLGCDVIQGYYFSKPLPKGAFEEYLKMYMD